MRALLVALVLMGLAALVLVAASDGDDSAPGPRRAPEAGGKLAVRAIFDRDSSATGFDDQAAIGFNTFDSGPWPEEMDALAARGVQGFVWLGGYSNESCRFRESDDWVRTRVSAIAGHRAVAAYLIDDEPLAKECPTAPAQVKARAELVKSIDPRPPTFVVIYRVDELKLFAGTVDILAVDRYPCSIRNGCDFSKIDEAIEEVDRLGVRYWAVIQAHGDDWYRVPTADELHEQFVRWRASRMEGYFVFAWRWPDDKPSLWLANHPELQLQLAKENAQPLHPDRSEAGP
jgi:hypothetical protein